MLDQRQDARDSGGNDPRHALRERGLMEIIGDTMSMYKGRLAPIAFISAAVLVPALALGFIPTESPALLALLAFIAGGAPIVIYAALAAAVGQTLTLGEISPAACFSRVAWRGVSVLALAALFGVGGAIGSVLLEPLALWFLETGELAEAAETPDALVPPPFPTASALAFLALGAAFIFTSVYMTTIAPAVMIEGRRGFGAAARGFQLARGSEWRIFGHLIIYFMVSIGVTFAVILPFLIAGGFAAGGGAPNAAPFIAAVGFAAAQIIAQPVTYIAATLLYFDIRLKSEEYGATDLAREMGAASA